MTTEAIVEFQKAIDLDPDFTAAHTGLGEVYLEIGQLDDAENAANAALKVDAEFSVGAPTLRGYKTGAPHPSSTHADEVSKYTAIRYIRCEARFRARTRLSQQQAV